MGMMDGERRGFGSLPDGRPVELFTLRNAYAEVGISTLGATVVSVRLPDRRGIWADVALGFEGPVEYLRNPGDLGATIGRYAGRIAEGQFLLNGRRIQLARNRGRHTIHGGPEGFHLRLWQVLRGTADELELELVSPDGDQGFPGALTVQAGFYLEADTLTLTYRAVSDRATVCSFTNHTYWNLAGQGRGTIDPLVITVPADEYLETDAEKIPTGRILPLKDTSLDLRRPVEMRCVHADHTFLLPGDGTLHPAGRVMDPASGRILEVETDYPAVQVYTADGMAEARGKAGTVYGPRRGFCLETQCCPDAPNHPNFPSALLRAGETFFHQTVWRFGIM